MEIPNSILYFLKGLIQQKLHVAPVENIGSITHNHPASQPRKISKIFRIEQK